jgi:NAD(P)-dependent dehydrogenase (short-subunit alcohol dehydrogenase family)
MAKDVIPLTKPFDADGGTANVAVITGASRGLGAGMAASFAGRGWRLGLCARRRPEPGPAAEGTIIATSVDVADAEAVSAFADEVVERFGRIDLWVNNAGVLDPIGPLADADPASLRRHLEVNVLGTMHGAAAFARHVRSRPGGGLLVNVSSGAASTPYEGWSAYCGSKAAVDMVTAVLGREERATGLSVIALSPGVVDTDMQALIRATSKEDFPAVDRFHKLRADGAFNDPDWVAQFVLSRFADRPRVAVAPDSVDSVRVRAPEQSRRK